MNRTLTTTQLSKLDHHIIVLDRVLQPTLDYIATLPIPSELTLTDVPVQDQGQTSCCVSISVAHTLCKQWNRLDFNPLFINNFRNLLESLTDAGMTPVEALTFVYFYGCATKDRYNTDHVWINDGTVSTREISREVIEESRKFCIAAFGVIHSPDVVIEVLKIGEQHPALFGGVIITLPIFNDSPQFWRGQKAQYWHEVVVVAYDEQRDRFKIQNSWGTDWADSGFTWLDRDEWSDVVVQTMFSTSNKELAAVLLQHVKFEPTFKSIEAAIMRSIDNMKQPSEPGLSYIHVEGEPDKTRTGFVAHPRFMLVAQQSRLVKRFLGKAR